jgi:hypothetical protein
MTNASQNISSERSDQNVQRFLWKLLLPFYSRRFFFVALILHLILFLIFANTIFFQRWLDLQEQEEHGNFICAKPSEKPPGGNSPPPASVQLNEVPQPITSITVQNLSVNTLKDINVSVPTMVQENVAVPNQIAESFLESGIGNGIGKGSGTGIGDAIGNGIGKGGGSIFNTKISGENLVVIIDISSSMAPYLETVFQEVRRDFPNATYKYSVGCCFVPPPPKIDSGKVWKLDFKTEIIKRFISVSGIPKAKEVKPEDIYDSMSNCLLEILKSDAKVDSIYLFADYQDGVDKRPGFSEGIISASRQKHPKIFFHSIDRENEVLAKIAVQTKGSFFVKKIDIKK